MLHSLVLWIAVVLGLSGCSAPAPVPAAHAASDAPTPQSTEAVDADVDALRALLLEAEARRDAQDFAAARVAIRELIDRALVELAEREDAAAVGLVAELGRFAHHVGELKSAERARARVLEVQTRTLPAEHPDLQRAKGNLAVTIAQLGDLAGARAVEESVLEVWTRTLPADYPDLLNAKQNLAGTILVLGGLASASALFESALEVRTRMLPADHPALLMAKGNLAVTIKGLGDLAGARALEESVLEGRTRTLPAEHPNLQAAKQNLAVTIAAETSRAVLSLGGGRKRKRRERGGGRGAPSCSGMSRVHEQSRHASRSPRVLRARPRNVARSMRPRSTPVCPSRAATARSRRSAISSPRASRSAS